MTKRAAGILLPVTSLPSDYGIGCFSEQAYEFADILAESGQGYWQILPIGPTGFGDSPYQSFSSYAGNPYLIDLGEFIKDGILSESECKIPEERYIDYEYLYKTRFKLLYKAYEKSEKGKEFEEFKKQNQKWLDDYALFTAIKEQYGGAEWISWDNDIKKRSGIGQYARKLWEKVEFYKFVQYKFYSQWNSLKKYVNSKGIKIIGDIPIYVSYDSADVWANPELFCLDSKLLPTAVAGCPPDGFSPEGQLWGNPLYNWEVHRKDGFSWWIERIRHSFELFDVLRIDHFRGFDKYYSIPFGSDNAKKGKWIKAPGRELFETVENSLGKPEFIAEDLGFVTDSVKELLNICGFPGMRVLQFAFDERDTGSTNDYLPHNYIKNCVAYTGTHDNETTAGWFCTLPDKAKKTVRKYLCDFYTPDEKMNLPLIGSVMRSSADLCIIPLQDYMGLGSEARINTPSTLGNNWRWKLKKGETDAGLINLISDITAASGRRLEI